MDAPQVLKPTQFSQHAREQMEERGAKEQEVVAAIRNGERVPAKKGRQGFRKNFEYNQEWGGRNFAVKQVMPIVAEELDSLVVVTVYTFYF